ncbi:class I SAM-dependent methyltransferase [Veillonella sp.]
MNDSFNHIIHPKEDDKTFITSYWTERAEDFRKLREKELQSPKLLLWRDELVKHLKEKNGLRILDIGCGAGFFSIILSQLGHIVMGIDITPNMIEESKLLAQSVGSTAQFAVMDAENLDFDDNTFDIIVARNVTWNLPHPDKAYAEWLRVIRPDGLILNYDAEHARNHHDLPQSVHHAHEHVSNELKERCHTIYHMLEISSFTRPQWDKELLTKLGASSVTIDPTVGPRIYSEEDEFYIPVPMFLVKVIK